jgi:signal transduction histidine kinase
MTSIDYGGREAIQWIGHDVTEQIELARMRDDLMHMIVHDLRNPLGNVISSLQMMRTALIENDKTLPMMDVLQVAMRSSEKLRRLIDSLLSLRQLEAGKADLDTSLVPPKVLTHEAIEIVRPIIEKKEQELVLDIPIGLPPVRVDRDMASRVLTNLLDNAAKFTPTNGKIGLTIAEHDGELLFTVSDTGPGIPAESQEHIFERFTRLESAKGTRGTGLGLPFCKLAVEAHGGKIWVESTPGEGSRFKFSLPLEGQ